MNIRKRRPLALQAYFTYLLIMLGMFCANKAVLAQEPDIKGKVMDEAGKPIAGATVRVLSTSKSAATNQEGLFSVAASKGEQLQISFLGFQTDTIQVEFPETFLTIRLHDGGVHLDDVVIIGYGTQKKESLTGSVASLKNDDIIKTKAPSLAQAIQGKVSGLRIRQEDGQPGNFSSNINIRGLGTPLFIIDGVVRDGASEFQRLNPEDIESISFLKDATAAIYGMNSANGAIIVTTKKGAQGKTRISITSNLGISSPTHVPLMANAGEYMTLRNEAEVNSGKPPYLTAEELAKWQAGAPGYETVDLWDAITNKNAVQNQTTLSLDGGNDKVTYFGSLGYANDHSILKNDAMTYGKYTFRSNVQIKISENLTGSINIGGRMDKTDRPWFSFFDIFKGTRVNPPITSIYANDNPAYYNNFSYVPNPAALIDKDYTGSALDKNKNLQSQFSLEYKFPFVEGLKVKGSLVYDYNNYQYKGIRKAFDTYTYGDYTGAYTAVTANAPSLVQNNRREAERLDLQAQATYDRYIANNHHIGATYVFERREEMANWMNGERKFDFFSVGELDNGRSSDQIVSGSSSHEAYLSHIGRLTYDFKGKYLAEAAFRYDGSYRYAPGSRWALFPSGSLGWRLSEESFVKDHLPFVNNWKIRASAGRSGQDAGNPFQYLAYYGLNNGGYAFQSNQYTTGVSSPALINNNLTWVKVNMYNLGMDVSVLDNALSLEFDVYQRERHGLLADRYGSLPNTFGSSLPQENLNSDRTQGIEFTLTHEHRINDFHYSLSGNFNLARTKNLYVERGPFNSSWDQWRNQAANRWNDFIWGYQIDGRFLNQEQINSSPIQNGDNGNSKELPGDYILKDVNGDGIVNDLDKTPLFWSSTPQVHFGFNIQADWKGFDLYALFQGSAFYTVQFDEVYAKMLAFKGGNTPAYFYDRWHLADPYDPNSEWIPGEWPAIRLEQDMGSFYTRDSKIWRKDASYVRLKTVELGYTFDASLLKKVGIAKLRVYANGNNLLTICDPFVKPFDPEKIEGAYSAGLNYPISKSFNFGLTADF